jgi:hypothetical protein
MAFSMIKHILRLCVLGSSAICALPVLAAERPFLDGMPAEQFNKIRALQDALASVSDEETARGVYMASTVWPPSYRKLKVCFFGGTEEARKLIAEKAMEWMRPDMGITLDFGKSGIRSCKKDSKVEMHIRIGFEQRGYWSALGHDSVVTGFFPQDTNSMNLNGFANKTSETWSPHDTGTVHHEFGHALALGHEHQNPKSPCEEEYDWIKVYKSLGGPPNNWPKTQIDFNMREYRYDDTAASDFNVQSVMIYQFPPDVYKAGAKAKCYIEQPNNEISEGDRTELARLYPANDAARVERFQEAKAAFQALWDKVDQSSKAKLSIDPMSAFFGQPVADVVESEAEE